MNQLIYTDFIQEVREHIIRSRYTAARMVNREPLLLYFLIGKRLSEKVSSQKWGAKVIEQIAVDLQKELPGLRGFSYRNLQNMRQFALEYSEIQFMQSLTAQIASISTNKMQDSDNKDITIVQLPAVQLEGLTTDLFFGIGFTNHIILLNKCKDWQMRLFYLRKSIENSWTGEMLDWQIKANLYQKVGKTIQNENFRRVTICKNYQFVIPFFAKNTFVNYL